ncbi:MAG: YwaF family protein [Clostridia bacterium]|nr:YwaF family protein [Clostridia bacterium]
MFTGLHFAWLAICIVIIGGLLLWSLLQKWKYKTALYVAAGYSAVSELVKVFSRIKTYDDLAWKGGSGGFIDPSALPLHLCSILIFVVFILIFTKNEKLKSALLSFYVPVGLVGGLCALLIPNDGVSFASVKVWQGFIYHSCTIWFSLYLIITKQVDLKLRAYIRNVIILLALVVVMIWVNGALQIYSMEGYNDINYFFLVHPPIDGLPILNLNHGYAAYLATIIAIGFIAVSAVHIGPVIRQLKERYKKKENE